MNKEPITIITPCYNENVIVIKFLESLESVLSALPNTFTIVVVNDCSNDNTLSLLQSFRFKSPHLKLRIVDLKYNVGHQSAIYQGFLYAQKLQCDNFIVMDSDGEDAPSAIPELLQHLDYQIVNVVRNKRKESFLFRLFYRFYKMIFKFVTGKQMNFGNYCLIKRVVMERAIFSSFSHFAAFLSKQKYTKHHIVADRDSRIGGQSKMGFTKLFYHAFRSFVEYGEDLLMLFFKGFIVVMGLLFAYACYVLYGKLINHTAIPGWASMVIIGLANLATIFIGVFILGLLLINLTNQKPNERVPLFEDTDAD